MRIRIRSILLALVLCLAGELLLPATARAYENMTISDVGLDLIQRYESFSEDMYYDAGSWYVGYGTLVPAGSYPNGISQDEALRILREELATHEATLNSFFARNELSPTQAQFDALVSFTYNLGSGWTTGSSDLLKIVRGEIEATRLETARAFGAWCHAGGAVLPGLARRRLEEAALYLDGSTEARDEFVYLALNRDSDASYSADFAVYRRGEPYGAFPAMIRLGYTLEGVKTADGTLLRPDSIAERNLAGSAAWVKNDYSGLQFSDVSGDAWYYDYVLTLASAGVVSGRENQRFDPETSVTVGEALKLAILAAGGEVQSPQEGQHWADGYAAYARERRYLSDGVLDDLDAPISRLDTARLIARALGFGQSFSDTPFSDVNDGYVTAVKEAGIVAGSASGTGDMAFHPGEALKRSEISAIIWRLQRAVALGTEQTVRYGSRNLSVKPGVPFNSYFSEGFSGSGTSMTYSEPGVSVRRGVDVSRYQGAIDWSKLPAQGVEFAILRVGGRYQESGAIYDDRLFEEYYEGARGAGLQIGVYFYSQAVSTDEAIEEADYVLSKLEGKTIDGPVVFDWESAGYSGARTSGTPSSVITDCAIAYCERVRKQGYTPMVYLMRYDGYMRYDLSRLLDYDWWYAGEYDEAAPKFFYDFQMWQYTSSASLDGVEGRTDMDLWFFRE